MSFLNIRQMTLNFLLACMTNWTPHAKLFWFSTNFAFSGVFYHYQSTWTFFYPLTIFFENCQQFWNFRLCMKFLQVWTPFPNLVTTLQQLMKILNTNWKQHTFFKIMNLFRNKNISIIFEKKYTKAWTVFEISVYFLKL